MKTASLTYPKPHYIDTAPLALRYKVLMAAIMSLIEAGQMARVLRLSHKVVRLVRTFTRLETHNHLLTRKLDMLIDKSWRERVLKELGGMRKLKLWDAAKARIEARQNRSAKPAASQSPDWLYTEDRIAESERLKARVRACGRATAHPRVFRDKYKMDSDGMFRLAPLPRTGRAAPQMKVYTQSSIVDYEWNNIPFAKITDIGPAMVWPAEFYAAMAVEADPLETESKSSEAQKKTQDDAYGEPWTIVPIISLRRALDPKLYQDIQSLS